MARDGIDEALSAVAAMLDHALVLDLPATVRYLAGESVSLLVVKGRTGDAEKAWRTRRVAGRRKGMPGPRRPELAGARGARLCAAAAADRPAGIRGWGGRSFAISSPRATGRGLRRTWMRALALGVSLERRAGRPDEAEVHLNQYLDLFIETDYARPVVREREFLKPALEGVLDHNPRPARAESAKRLLDSLDEFERWQQACQASHQPAGTGRAAAARGAIRHGESRLR